jgi:hypothetical protein
MEALIVEDNEFFRAFLREHLSSIRPQLKIHEAAGVVDGRSTYPAAMDWNSQGRSERSCPPQPSSFVPA